MRKQIPKAEREMMDRKWVYWLTTQHEVQARSCKWTWYWYGGSIRLSHGFLCVDRSLTIKSIKTQILLAGEPPSADKDKEFFLIQCHFPSIQANSRQIPHFLPDFMAPKSPKAPGGNLSPSFPLPAPPASRSPRSPAPRPTVPWQARALGRRAHLRSAARTPKAVARWGCTSAARDAEM
jgi:hypothetical protein